MSSAHDLTQSQHVRQMNRSRILTEIYRSPGITRRQLAQLTNLTEASLSRITKDLLSEGLLRTVKGQGESPKAERGTRGRPNVGLSLCSDGLYVLCLSLTAYEQKFSIIGATGERIGEEAIKGWPNVEPEDVLDQVSEYLSALRHRPGFKFDRLAGVSITVAGDVDTETGELLDAPSIGWKAYPLGERAQMTFGLPVSVQNIAIALHVAETPKTNGRDSQHSLMLHAGLGISASLVVKGMLSRGSEYERGIGNIIVERPARESHAPGAMASDGAAPGTFVRLDDISSGRAILKRLGHFSGNTATDSGDAGLQLGLPHTVRQANAGEPRSVAAFSEAGRALGLAFLSTLALAHPDRVILAGPLAAAKPFAQAFQDILRDYNRIEPAVRPSVEISQFTYLKATEISGLKRFFLAKPIAD